MTEREENLLLCKQAAILLGKMRSNVDADMAAKLHVLAAAVVWAVRELEATKESVTTNTDKKDVAHV
jgi:hypothetical protein